MSEDVTDAERIRSLESALADNVSYREGHPDMCCGQCIEENKRLQAENTKLKGLIDTSLEVNTASGYLVKGIPLELAIRFREVLEPFYICKAKP